MYRAKQMIKRNKATWIGPYMIQILYDREDLKEFKKYVLKRDENRCYICEQLFPVEELTVDHIRAKHKGGSDRPENLACCCLIHNRLKAHRTLEEYILFLIRDEHTDEALRSRLIMRFPQYTLKGESYESTGTISVPARSPAAAASKSSGADSRGKTGPVRTPARA